MRRSWRLLDLQVCLCFVPRTGISCYTHWGPVTHTCVSKLTIIGSDNGLSPGRYQAVIYTSDRILLIGSLEKNLPWNDYRNSYIFIQGNAVENIWKMAAVLPPCVTHPFYWLLRHTAKFKIFEPMVYCNKLYGSSLHIKIPKLYFGELCCYVRCQVNCSPLINLPQTSH